MNEAYLGGLVGALATYILTRGKELGDKILARYNRHRTALVKLEQIYCENLDIIYRNIDNIEKLSSAVSEASRAGAVAMYFGKFHPIPYDKSVLLDLTTVDFMNEVMALNIDYNRANCDLDTVAEMYEKMKLAFTEKQISDEFIKMTKILDISLKDIDKHTEGMLAKTGVLLAIKPPLLIRIIIKFMPKKVYGKRFIKMYEIKLKEVREGRQQVIEESKQKLEKLYGKK